MCKVGYFNCKLPCQSPRPHLCLPPHLPQGRSLSEWWRQGKADAPRIVFSCFFCQWGDCDFLCQLTLMEGEERVTILTPVLPGQSSICALVVILSWNWVICLKMGGLALYIFHCVHCSLSAIVHAQKWFKSSLHLAAFGGRFVYTGPPQSLW